MVPKIITLVRHGQAEHNATRNRQLRDPSLTPLGETQCHELQKSPFNPSTALLGFKKQVESGAKVVLLAELQEASELPCDTVSSRDVLEKEELFQGLDFSGLPDERASKKVRWAQDPQSLSERARIIRKWPKSRPEGHIVVVLHYWLLPWMTEDWAGYSNIPGTCHTGFRFCFFVDGDEVNASIIETDGSKERRGRGLEKLLGRTEVKQFGEVRRN
ncbi:hypothetical protein B9Z19DRAFT_1131022 [Tuber borchii]|uniref:Histidine phosphatase superfamily n=1 Tax=Tuber borchii TaxID=42251 RepID=A0A2T6ZJF5_TUBBO|nr:hypothetical protein B9Z19DRAFT_1131022 [Tuber borchii]